MNRQAARECRPRSIRFLGWLILPMVWVLLHAGPALAVPSYARQTHLPCSSCHVGAFGPELTPFGREFKLNGYTMKVGNDAKIPLSAMMVESFLHTGQVQDPADLGKPFKGNNNFSLDQASVFLAGRISKHAGVFAQATYSEVGGLLGWDNVDVRYARPYSHGKHNGVWGISINNNPTVSDVFNSAPAWMFPYMSSDLAPGAPAAPIILDGIGGQSIGATGYTQIDGKWYLEAGGYRSLSVAWTNKVNAGYDGKLSGFAPYARLTYTKAVPNGDFTLGGFLFDVNRGAVGEDVNGHAIPLPGPTDDYRDLGLSGDYEYYRGDNIFTANALYVHERQTLNSTFLDGGSTHLRNTLDSFNLKGSYWYQNTYGVSLAQFVYDGSNDLALYGNNGSPNTEGGIVEVDYNPFGKSDSWKQPYVNVRVGLQYTWYTKFSGLVHNIDGAGRNASGNDATYLYLWLAL
ncbi:cytochrome C [Oleiagrimonas citrea]|uniref:cytochrome C n=1 Tax=Oleiagrimonas citrea TaxID=1665687 RepID=UPI001F047334|nr:cytochrome C [Oleiagrimonas citrea]